MSETNELREKIVELLNKWGGSIAEAQSNMNARLPMPSEAIANSILALLPKMPELRWSENDLLLGDIFTGCVDYFGGSHNQGCVVDAAQPDWCRVVADDVSTEQEARAAVETVVRKALGW